MAGELEQPGSNSQPAKYVLRLYVGGSTSKSALAVENIKRICEQHLKNEYDLEVIDIFQQPNLARDEQIVAVPTLIKRLPFPLRRLIGDLSNLKNVLVGLDLVPEASRNEIRALAASLLTAQEVERRRVSRELHDQICQQLASLAIDIGGLAANPPPPEDAQSRLKALQARVVKASEATRHIAYELHPSVLDDLGLVASLRALCKEFSERECIPVEFNNGGPPGSVPSEVASCLYRVAQESLQNIAKHASAKHVSVVLTLRKATVLLTIADDGAGFDQEAVKGRGRLGLIGMEERARLVNGNLYIAAQPGQGTRIVLEVPLAANSL